jgi:hypothetical protein
MEVPVGNRHHRARLNEPYNTGMVIEQLLGPVPRDVFVEEYYLPSAW